MAEFTGPDGTRYSMNAALAEFFTHRAKQEFEHELVGWALQFLEPGKTFVDVGAHVGTWALPFARSGRAGHVVAIEASAENYAHLVAGVALNRDAGLIHPVHAAAGDVSGEVTLNVGIGDWSGFGCSVAEFPINGETRPERVRALRVDELELQNVGLVKIDVEGHERAVLRGMRATLERTRPSLLVEIWSDTVFPWYATERAATLAYLSELGYDVVPVAGWEHMVLAAYH